MSITVDIARIEGQERLALELLGPGLADRLKTTLDAAAATERSQHAYRNRTGNLEANTQAGQVIDSGTTVWCDLAEAMPYASYVNARGFSTIDAVAAGADAELAAGFNEDAAAIAAI